MELASQIGGDMEIGRSHVSELRRFSMLRTNHRVLDVGCGVGRTARWLVPFLADGSYEGFDISQPAIEWCQREITSQHPNFRFMHIDLANAAYNPAGKLRADELVFPYADEDFDLVCLFSVFTHLMPDDFSRYLMEIRRVLKPGGRMHATFFLLDTERVADLEASDHDIARSLTAASGPVHTGDAAADEAMVAYQEPFARAQLRKAGLHLDLIDYGRWPTWAMGAEEVMGPQDTVVAVRG